MSFSIFARLKSRDITARIFRTVSQARPLSRASSRTWRTSSSFTRVTGMSPMVGYTYRTRLFCSSVAVTTWALRLSCSAVVYERYVSGAAIFAFASATASPVASIFTSLSSARRAVARSAVSRLIQRRSGAPSTVTHTRPK